MYHERVSGACDSVHIWVIRLPESFQGEMPSAKTQYIVPKGLRKIMTSESMIVVV